MTLNHRAFKWLSGLLLVLAGLSGGNLVYGQNTAATDTIILTFSGKVEVSPRGSTTWNAAQAHQVLKEGDRVRTSKSSRATLRLSNLSLLRVYELTTMEIQPPEKAGHRPILNLESGAAYFFNRDKPSETQFRTPSASGAIRGTEFNLTVKPNGRMELALLDGQVDLTNNQGTLQIQSGEEAVADPGQAPKKVALIEAVSIIQWTLYYPAILDPADLNLDADTHKTLHESLSAYASGDLLQALAKYPADRTPASEEERVYRAELLLSVGQVDEAQQLLQEGMHDSHAEALANALRELIASVKGQPWTRAQARTLATEWLAGSYQAQSRRNLDEALIMARKAVAKSPFFAFGLERLAEMEFSFGHTEAALDALDKSLNLAPRNAEALALKGFALSAQNKISAAGLYFDQAIAADGSLANAWLGRGLVRIRQGTVDAGRKDLETAASLEPNRAFLRSYLGKAWSLDQPFQYTWDTHLATNELRRAMTLDPNDPTAWLYSALLNDQRNCINDAINDLEHSQALNDNRAVYRSKFLLDQDAAVRAANLALVYEDAGLSDVAVREATKSLNNDYANFSSHLFLSETYDALQDPRREDLRYQTPWEDELLIANLLAPVGAGVLAQNISQGDYSKLFQSDRLGVISQTEYTSRGAWLENSSEFGTFGPMAFALEEYYYTDPGWRPNNAIDNSDFDIKLKYQLAPKDTAFLQVERSEVDAGDTSQNYYYNRTGFYDPTFHAVEIQDPNILGGWRHDWGTGNQTVFLYRNMQDHYSANDSYPYYFADYLSATPPTFAPFATAQAANNNLQRTTDLNSLELQHIYEDDLQNIVVGGRFQNESMDTANFLFNPAALIPGSGQLPVSFLPRVNSTFERLSGYGYYTLKLGNSLKLTGGLTYDWESYPLNLSGAPLSPDETQKQRFSPKFGLDYTLPEGTRLRASYTRSMGGLINDSSTTIEPTEVGGFNQAYRALIPNSVGLATPPATLFETMGLGLDHKFSTGTYVDAEAQLLTSRGSFLTPAWSTALGPPPFEAIDDLTQKQYFQEKDFFASVSQLIGKDMSVGLRDTVTAVDLTSTVNTPANTINATAFNGHENSTLNEVTLFGNWYLPCGFFSTAEANWWVQHNALNNGAVSEPGDNFWQVNLYAGYRFPRRHIEIEAGILNVFDQNYNIDPVTYFLEQAHTRTFFTSLKFNF